MKESVNYRDAQHLKIGRQESSTLLDLFLAVLAEDLPLPLAGGGGGSSSSDSVLMPLVSLFLRLLVLAAAPLLPPDFLDVLLGERPDLDFLCLGLESSSDSGKVRWMRNR